MSTVLHCSDFLSPYLNLLLFFFFLQYIGAFLAAFHKLNTIYLACAYLVLPNVLYIINRCIVNLKHLLYTSIEILRQSLLYF